MIQYEMLLLLRPDLVQEKQDEIKERIEKTIQEEQGVFSTYDRWGKYLLAYPVQKCTYGTYVLVRFSVDEKQAESLLEKLKTVCTVRFNTLVMRHVIVRLPVGAPVEYRRPDSLEEAPRRDKTYDLEGHWEGRGRRNAGPMSVAGEILGDSALEDIMHNDMNILED